MLFRICCQCLQRHLHQTSGAGPTWSPFEYKKTSRPADENELDEPMGILPSPHIRSGHTTHHRGPINLSSLLSPPCYPKSPPPLAPPHLHVCQLQCPVLQREDVKKVFHSVRLKHLREHVDPVTTFWDQSFFLAFTCCQDDLIWARRELGKTQSKAVDFPVE